MSCSTRRFVDRAAGSDRRRRLRVHDAGDLMASLMLLVVVVLAGVAGGIAAAGAVGNGLGDLLMAAGLGVIAWVWGSRRGQRAVPSANGRGPPHPPSRTTRCGDIQLTRPRSAPYGHRYRHQAFGMNIDANTTTPRNTAAPVDRYRKKLSILTSAIRPYGEVRNAPTESASMRKTA